MDADILMRIIEELTRRRLIQTAALYIAVAWGGTEILVFLVDGLLGEQAAATARRYFAILLIAGFPAALYLAWTKDLGLKARRLFSATAVALLIVATLLYTVPEPIRDTAIPLIENSIAVLPFEVCEDRPSDSALAGGLTGEVLNRLAESDRLKIKGRRSVETVVSSASSMGTIAGLLGVEYLLNGVLCRDGLDLTLHAELMDNKGFIVWKEDFEQTVNRFDQVEERLGSLVAQGVGAKLGDITNLPRDAAVNRKALEYLLIGQQYLHEDRYDEAREAFENALDIEPQFAAAELYLARIEAWACDDDAMNEMGKCIERARPIAEKALKVAITSLRENPDSFENHKVAGEILAALARWGEQITYRNTEPDDEVELERQRAEARALYADAEKHFRSALALNPSSTDVRIDLAYALEIRGVQGRKESKDILSRGLDRDPFNESLASLLAYRLAEFGDVRGAMETLDRFGKLPQGKGRIWWNQLEILQNLGRFDEKLAVTIENLREDETTSTQQLWWTVADIARLGLFEEAAKLHDLVSQIPDQNTRGAKWFRQLFLVDMYLFATGRGDEVFKRKYEAISGMSDEEILRSWETESHGNIWTLWNNGERLRAIKLMESLQNQRVRSTMWAERQMWYSAELAYMYVQVGRDDDARPLLQFVIAHDRAEIDGGVRHPATLAELADAYARWGDGEAALEMLDLAIDYGAWDENLCCEEYLPQTDEEERIQIEPWWRGLEDDPRFIQSRSRMRSLVDQQRSNIRALLAQNDMEALVAPMIKPVQAAASDKN